MGTTTSRHASAAATSRQTPPGSRRQTKPAFALGPGFGARLAGLLSYLEPAQPLWQLAVQQAFAVRRQVEGRKLRRLGFREEIRCAVDQDLHFWVGKRAFAGPPWVFIHGFSAEAIDWVPLFQELDGRVPQLIAVDLPGHGASPLPKPGYKLNPDSLVQAARRAVELPLGPGEQAVVVANSLGGLAALKLASMVPALIEGLVLISPAGAPLSTGEARDLQSLFTLGGWRGARRFVDLIFPTGAPFPGANAVALALWAQLGRPHLRELATRAEEAQGLEAKDLSALPPTLLIWGELDKVLPASGLDFFRQHLPPDRTQVLTPLGFSHSPFVDKASEVAPLLLNWAAAREAAEAKSATTAGEAETVTAAGRLSTQLR